MGSRHTNGKINRIAKPAICLINLFVHFIYLEKQRSQSTFYRYGVGLVFGLQVIFR